MNHCENEKKKKKNTVELKHQVNSTFETLIALVFGDSRNGAHKETPGDVEFVNNQANPGRIPFNHFHLVLSGFLVRFTGTLGSTPGLFMP